MIRKAEYMIPYHMARCPNYGWKESPEYARAEELKEKIAGIGQRPTPIRAHSPPMAPHELACSPPPADCDLVSPLVP